MLGQLLGSEARARVLTGLLLGAPTRSYVRDFARRLHLPATAVSRELRTLERLGLVLRERDGRRVYYQPNRNASVLTDLRGLVLKFGGVTEALQAVLNARGDSVAWAFVYGSLAAGRATAVSDVDLLIVGDIAPSELHETVRPLADALGREINTFVVTPREFREERRHKNHFVARVLAGPKIDLIGNARSAQTAR